MDVVETLYAYLDRHASIRRCVAPMRWVASQAFRRKRRRNMEALHWVLENVVGGNLVVRLAGFPGEYELDVRSHVLRRILLDKEYEPRLVELVSKYVDPQKDAIDVGANVGLFSVLIAALLGPDKRVLAVEPTPRALSYLRGNLARNQCASKVAIYEGIASNAVGETTIVSIQGKEEYSSIGGIVHGSVDRNETKIDLSVATSTLDTLVTTFGLNPGFVKIDTEGAEYLVLSGASNLLAKFKPVIVSELQDNLLASLGHSAASVVELLREHGYRVVDLRDLRDVDTYPFNGDILALPVL